MSKVKCPVCSELFDKSKTPGVIHFKNRYYHRECFAIKFPEGVSFSENKDYKELKDYILKLFNYSELPLKIERMIGKYLKENKYTYSGIHKTLYWFYEVQKNSISKANGGIGIVPYVYEEAKEYYRKIHEAQINNANALKKDLEIKSITIVLKEPVLKPKKKRVFNIEEILEEETSK